MIHNILTVFFYGICVYSEACENPLCFNTRRFHRSIQQTNKVNLVFFVKKSRKDSLSNMFHNHKTVRKLSKIQLLILFMKIIFKYSYMFYSYQLPKDFIMFMLSQQNINSPKQRKMRNHLLLIRTGNKLGIL